MSNIKIIKQVTCTAPVNIAVIKYWGKRNEELILPTNSSLSCTLSQDQLRTKTSIGLIENIDYDRLWLNGKEESVQSSKRLMNCLNETRRLRKLYEQEQLNLNNQVEILSDFKVHIISANNFPTAAGLASSASGYACLVFALCKIYELPLSLEEQSKIARVGSGSACRSLFGGFVAWRMGEREDGEDSKAELIANEQHWPEMEALIVVVSDRKKGTSSTVGMQTTVQTSELLQHRIKEVVPKRMKAIEEAILKKDFQTFAEITMKDSNQFHAVCQDTYPPISYMNDVSKAIIQLITKYNSGEEGIKAAYTYDAGPNAVIYAPRAHMKELIQLIHYYFPSSEENTNIYFNDPLNLFNEKEVKVLEKDLPKQVLNCIPIFPKGSVTRLIHTNLGDGPRVLDIKDSLLNESGLPKED